MSIDLTRVKVMVTISVKDGEGPWRDRTLTLSDWDRPTVREAWLHEFPRLMDRALVAAPDEPVDGDEPEATAP